MTELLLPGVLRRTDPAGAPVPLVFDSPHSGLGYPPDFRPAIPMAQCERVADWHVEALFGAAPAHGATLIEALFRRAYVDANRSDRDLDPAMIEGGWPGPVEPSDKTARGAGVVWRVIDGETPIYDRKLTAAEIRHRLESCWRPYHAEVEAALDARFRRFGRVFHLDCHSMPEWGEPQGNRRPDFILGTLDGTTASPGFTAVVADSLRAAGYSVAVDLKFKGVELIRRYSDPAAGRESLQIEVNRGIYMDEATLARSERFAATRAAITRMIAAAADYAATDYAAAG